MSEGIKAFGDMIAGVSGGCRTIGKALATHLGVPYYEDREKECLLGHRLKAEGDSSPLLPTRRFRLPDGATLDTQEFPPVDADAEQLTEEVWSRNHRPDVIGDAMDALRAAPAGIIGIYMHMPTLCLVVIDPSGKKIGIRSTALQGPFGVLSPEILRNWTLMGKFKRPATA